MGGGAGEVHRRCPCRRTAILAALDGGQNEKHFLVGTPAAGALRCDLSAAANPLRPPRVSFSISDILPPCMIWIEFVPGPIRRKGPRSISPSNPVGIATFDDTSNVAAEFAGGRRTSVEPSNVDCGGYMRGMYHLESKSMNRSPSFSYCFCPLAGWLCLPHKWEVQIILKVDSSL